MSKKLQFNENRQIQFLKIFLTVVIVTISLWKIGDFDQIVVLNDEFGYWSIGAFLAGKDWSNLASQAPYYSYGYSFLLVPLFYIFQEPEMMYKAAVFLNMIMLTGSFFLCIRLAKKLFTEIDERILVLISFVVTMYCSNVVQVHVAWTEIYLAFLFWIIANLVYDVIEKPANWRLLVLSILSVYLYIVHQRTLGILAAVVLFIALLKLLKRLSWKGFFIFFGVLFLGVFLQKIAKGYIMSSIFQNNELVANNDYSGQVGKFVLLFSKDGLIYFLQSIAGKIYYLGVSSFLLLYFGIGHSIKQSFSGVTKFFRKRIAPGEKELFEFFAFCAFAATFMVTAIYTLAPGRIDTLIYGRYNEFSIGIILLIGIAAFWKSKSRIIQYSVSFLVLCFSAYITNGALKVLDNRSFAVINAIGVSKFFENNVSPVNLVYVSIAFVSVIAVILLFLTEQRWKKSLKVIGLSLVALTWIVTGQGVVDDLLLYMQKSQSQTITSLADCMRANAVEAPVYYFKSSETKDVNIEYFQYLLPDTEIHSVEFEEFKEEKAEEAYLLFLNTDKNIQKIQGKYRIIGQSPEYVLMTKAGNKIDQTFQNNSLEIDPTKCLSDNRDEEIFDELISDGQKGYLIKNKGLILSAGTYNLTVSMKLHYTDTVDLGYIEVTRSKQSEKIKKDNLKRTEFNNENTLTKSIQFSCNNSYLDVSLRMLTKKGVRLEVTGITLEKISNEYAIGEDTKNEIHSYGNLLDKVGVKGNFYYYTENGALQSDCSFKYLEEIWGQNEIQYIDRNALLGFSDTDETKYILMEKPANIFEYQEILEHYIILDSGKKYLLLTNVGSEAVSKSIEAGYSTLSDVGVVKLNYYAKNKGTTLQNTEKISLEKGSYEVTLDLNIKKASEEKIGRFIVYYRDDILNSRELLSEDIVDGKLHVSMPVSTFYNMGYISIGVSDASGAEFLVEQITIKKVSEDYVIDLEKGVKERTDKDGETEILTSKIPMSTGKYFAEYTLKPVHGKGEAEGTLFMTGDEVLSESVKVTSEGKKVTVKVPFEIGFDIISLKDLHTKVQFGMKSKSKWEIETIKIGME